MGLYFAVVGCMALVAAMLTRIRYMEDEEAAMNFNYPEYALEMANTFAKVNNVSITFWQDRVPMVVRIVMKQNDDKRKNYSVNRRIEWDRLEEMHIEDVLSEMYKELKEKLNGAPGVWPA